VHGQRSAHGAQEQTNPAGDSSSGDGGHNSAKVTKDLTSIPASMISLFQQFLTSMGNKNEVGKSHVPEVFMEKAEHANVGGKAKAQMEG
jgi:hypothetical protein